MELKTIFKWSYGTNKNRCLIFKVESEMAREILKSEIQNLGGIILHEWTSREYADNKAYVEKDHTRVMRIRCFISTDLNPEDYLAYLPERLRSRLYPNHPIK